VAEDLREDVLRRVRGPQNPVIRLISSDTLLWAEGDLFEARREAVLELLEMGWGHTKIAPAARIVFYPNGWSR
jgi:hypothetical protein